MASGCDDSMLVPGAGGRRGRWVRRVTAGKLRFWIIRDGSLVSRANFGKLVEFRSRARRVYLAVLRQLVVYTVAIDGRQSYVAAKQSQ